MAKYEARRCEPPDHLRWGVYVDGLLGRVFDTEEQAAAEAVRLQASWDAMLEQVNAKAGVLREGARHIGPVQYTDELHALQYVGRSAYFIHLQAALSRPLTVGENADITYCNGRGAIKLKQNQEHGVSR